MVFDFVYISVLRKGLFYLELLRSYFSKERKMFVHHYGNRSVMDDVAIPVCLSIYLSSFTAYLKQLFTLDHIQREIEI